MISYVQTLLAQIQQQNEELEQAKSTSPQDIKTRARKRPRLSEQTKGSSPRLDASASTAAHARTRVVAEPSATGDAVASVPGSPSSIEQEVEVAVDVEEEGNAVLTPGRSGLYHVHSNAEADHLRRNRHSSRTCI